MATAHMALCKTGTVSLEIAKYGVPMIATYRVNPFTAWAVKRMLRIPYVNLINIMSGREVIPELLQERCRADHMVRIMQDLLQHPEKMQAQVNASYMALQALRTPEGGKASDMAARI
jgi:lipid-A-disaccharide synthase